MGYYPTIFYNIYAFAREISQKLWSIFGCSGHEWVNECDRSKRLVTGGDTIHVIT